MNTASVEKIRTHFPALQRIHNGHNVAYFDGPGGTQVPNEVTEAVCDYLLHHNANAHWAFPTSNETDEIVNNARNSFADFFNCAPTEIMFGPNMTTLTFHLARAIGRTLAAGDEIIVTELDHHANIDPWRALEVEKNLVVRTARMIPETGQIDWEHLEGLVSKRTKLLAMGAASNALGTINDIARASRLAKSVQAFLFVDAVHFAPHEFIDVKELNCDFCACSAYKIFGPHLGIMYGKLDLLNELSYPRLQPAPNHAPDRAETGTNNFEGIAGAAAAIDLLASFSSGATRREQLQHFYKTTVTRATELSTLLWDGLKAIDRISTYGPPPDKPRTPTISFTLDGISAKSVCQKLADAGMFASHGDFYAQTVVKRLGLEQQGLVRIGCVCYSTKEEVSRLLQNIEAIASSK